MNGLIRNLPGTAGIIFSECLYPGSPFVQIELNFAPCAAVVYLISVGSGGYFFAFSLDG